jgi:hypothetical protein
VVLWNFKNRHTYTKTPDLSEPTSKLKKINPPLCYPYILGLQLLLL